MVLFLFLLFFGAGETDSAIAAGDVSVPNALEEARNFHAISETLLTSGQVYPSQVPDLQAEGVEFVVNLAVADPERNVDEAFAVMSAGVSYLNIPVLWGAPTQDDLTFFFDAMDARGERVTLVHCFANFRASAFTYLYRVLREGVPEEQAREDLMAVWSEALFEQNPVWREFIDNALSERPGMSP
ncbi:MAG: protein tyrosine phosphatase family protein [Pseudomonadota bacterium]